VASTRGSPRTSLNSTVTVPWAFGDLPQAGLTKRVEIPDDPNYFLSEFGPDDGWRSTIPIFRAQGRCVGERPVRGPFADDSNAQGDGERTARLRQDHVTKWMITRRVAAQLCGYLAIAKTRRPYIAEALQPDSPDRGRPRHDETAATLLPSGFVDSSSRDWLDCRSGLDE